jgi:FSR family fosmidomycin resistance protein-like MFS transporter
MSWAHFLNDGAANYLPGVLPAVLVALHDPVSMAGVLVAALWIGQASQPLMGVLADRIGGRSLIVAGLLLSSLGGALIGLASSTVVLIGVLILIGLGNAAFHPQSLAGVRGLAGDQQGLLTSVFLVGGELGRGIWPTAAGLVGVALGLHQLWILAIPALITAPLLARWAPSLPARTIKGRSIRWREHAHPMALLVAYRGLQAFAMFGLATFIPIMWHARGGSLVAGASIITAMLVVGVIGNLAGGHLADRIGRRPIMLTAAIASAALTLPIVYVRGFWVWVFASALGIVLFSSISASILIGQEIFPENRSMGSGIALGLANGLGAVLVLVLGLWVNTADLPPVFWALSGACALSALFALAFPRALMLGAGGHQ